MKTRQQLIVDATWLAHQFPPSPTSGCIVVIQENGEVGISSKGVAAEGLAPILAAAAEMVVANADRIVPFDHDKLDGKVPS